MSSSTRPARLRGPIALAAAAGLAALLVAPAAGVAQDQPAPRQPRRPAAPAAQPAPAPAPAPAIPAPQASPAAPGGAAQQPTGPTVVQVKAEPSQPEWTKVCGKDQGTNTEICYTTRDFVSDQGQPVLAVAVYDVKGAAAAAEGRLAS